jgi:hypothetical protein
VGVGVLSTDGQRLKWEGKKGGNGVLVAAGEGLVSTSSRGSTGSWEGVNTGKRVNTDRRVSTGRWGSTGSKGSTGRRLSNE